MFKSSLAKIGMRLFGINRSGDAIVRLMLLFALMVVWDMFVRAMLKGLTVDELPHEVMMSMLVALPLVGLCYLLLWWQHSHQMDLTNAASTDDLTGLPNRRAFFDRAKRALSQRRNGFFLIIDADHFKRINDTLGHPTGDVCLQAIADRIQSLLREQDLVGRIGGEEFGMLLFDRSLEDLQRLSGRLCFPINVSIQGHSEPLRLTVSAGATEIWPHDKVQDLTARADEALFAAKNNGRERMVLWRPIERASVVA